MAHGFHLPVGYSDHTIGIEVTLAAVALGACIIEKHFTLDKALPGPDHQASLEPDELSDMTKKIRMISVARGNGIKRPTDSELSNRTIVRRSLAASKSISVDSIIKEKDLFALRPDGKGISPSLWEQVVGKKVKHALKAGDFINWSHLE